MKAYTLFILAFVLIQSTVVVAQETQWYVGVAGGATSVKDLPGPDDIREAIGQEIDIGRANFPQDNSLDDTDTFWKVFSGYQFNPYFGLELFYADLGEARAKWSAADFSGFPFFSGGKVGGSYDYSAQTVGMYLVASYPFSSGFHIYGKAGAHYYDVEVTAQSFSSGLAFPETHVTETFDDKGAGFAFGAGLGYDFSPRWGVILDWERFEGISSERADIATDAVSAGLRYRF
jgi:opacity protein-like surface antigen